MHGYSPEFLVLVNAEVDSMGGVIDGGVGIDSKISPRRAAIEKAQAELRLEYDVREERRRELEFLEKGGNPLDFKLGPATSISVQSTSVAEQFVNSEAKGSFALTASPRGDSVESSGRPGAGVARETNTADNLLLFDRENDTNEGERISTHRSRSNTPASEQVSHLDGCHSVKESEESGMLRFVVKSQAYARRNRSSTSRDSARLVGDRNGSSVVRSRQSARDTKGISCEGTLEKDRNVKSSYNLKTSKPNGNVVGKALSCDKQLAKEVDVRPDHESVSGSTIVEELDARASKRLRVMECNELLQVDVDKNSKFTTSSTPENVVENEGVSSAPDGTPSAASTKVENLSGASLPNNVDTSNIDVEMPKESGNNSIPIDRSTVDPESSCIQIGASLEENTVSGHHPNLMRIHSPDNLNKETTLGTTSVEPADVNLVVKEECDTKAVEVPAESNDHSSAICLKSNNCGASIKVEEETNDSRSGTKNEVKPYCSLAREEVNDNSASNTGGKPCDLVGDSNVKSISLSSQDRPSSIAGPTNCNSQEVNLSGRGLVDAPDFQTCDESQLKLSRKVHEDSILEEARSIEAKRKRIAELSVRNYPSEYRRKSHWDFVLEEMAWLANDFMQERLWKTTAAAQISHKAALGGQMMINKQNQYCQQKQIAHALTKDIMQFWHSAEELLSSGPSIGLTCDLDLVESEKVDEASKDRIRDSDMEMSENQVQETTVKSQHLAVQEYAVRFLKYSSSIDFPIQTVAPKTPERLSDSGLVELLLDDQLTEETLFYTVPPGAMEEYRKSLENYWSQYEKIGGRMHTEEVETSIYGGVEEFVNRENVYEDDDGDAYYVPGAFECSKPSKSAQKKKKNLPKSYARSYDMGTDFPYGQFIENKAVSNHPLFLGKRPSNNLNVGSIPIKRIRTASRRMQIPNKADASSGDTSSYQDDQSTINGGSNIRKSLEVESTGDFGNQLPFDCTEVSMKHKKKKKAKHLVYKNSLNSTDNGAFVIGKGPAYEQRWQHDSMAQNEQREYPKKRSESHAFESNGNSGVFVQHATKRPKISKQMQDTSESNGPLNGLVPSPVASQMSNMSNPNKFMKMIAGRDRGRKSKALKMPAGQSGAGSPWSLFEDQALVVLVHDMGPNWELVSDAISSTLQFKCIFRNPKECKERHKILMDRNAGDGADSAEDSGSSQPYPSTLPGIPKGSARQLFQRLQGPMEEDTLKSHFEKIILIGQKLHSRRSQSESQSLKQIMVHNSHIVAISQVCPNNLNGGVLTPLDLCDTTTSSSDAVSLGYQGPHTSGLAIANQGPTPPALPTSGPNHMLQGSAAMVLDNTLPSSSSAPNMSSRDGQRYAMPRPNIENQKMQQYNQMLPGRSSQQSGISAPGPLPTDRGVRMLPGGNGIGVMSGASRGMTIPRPGYQGMGSPVMPNISSGSMVPSSGVGVPNSVAMSNGAVPAQGNSMMRPREALHMMRGPEEQRQMTIQELHMQATQGNNQAIPPFSGLSTGYPNQTVSSPIQTFSAQHQQQHQMGQQPPHVLNNPHHPHIQGSSHATSRHQQVHMHAKERHRFMQHQQQHQYSPSNVTIPQVQSPLQHPVSSVQSSSQIQQQAPSQSASLPSPNAQHPLTSSPSPMNPVSSQSQQKQLNLPLHGLGRNPQQSVGNLPNQVLKQRQRQQQPHQQPGRQHPHQRQPAQSQQQAKLVKGMSRGNMLMHQNIPVDASHVNGLSITPGNHVADKVDQAMQLMQGQGVFSGSGLNPVQAGKSLVSAQTATQGSSQQKLFSRSPTSSSKQMLQMPSITDNGNQGQIPSTSAHTHTMLASQQSGLPLAIPPPQQQQQQHLRHPGQSQQPVHRVQQNRKGSSDSSLQSSFDQIQINQQPLNSTFHMATSTALTQCCGDSTNVIPVTSGGNPSQWKAQEPLGDLGTPNAVGHLSGNPSIPCSSGSEPVGLPSHGIIQRQASGSLPVHNHSIQTQWQPHLQQQKQQPLQSPQQPSPQLTQQQPPAQHIQLQHQSQQHPKHNLHLAEGGQYAGSTSSGPT